MSEGRLSSRSLFAAMQARGGAEFLVRPGQRPVTYDRLVADVRACCGLFDARGLHPGDRVLILTGDEGVAATLFVAAFLDGLVPVMLTADTLGPRAAGIVAVTEPGLIVADVGRAGDAWAAGAITVEPPAKSLFGRARPRSGLSAELARQQPRDPRLPEGQDTLAYILFTSGTTAAPKGVMISHRAIFSHLATLSRLGGYGRDSRIFNTLVFAHADGLVQGPLLALANGCALIRPGPFALGNLEAWMDQVRAHRATHFLSVPTIYAVIDRYASHDDYFDAPEFRILISAAARLDETLWRRLEQRFKRPVFNQYGLTETTTAGVYAGPHPEMGPIGTIGKPVDMEARLVGENGGDVDGQSGELWLRGDNLFSGYWRDPVRTGETLTDDAWLRTGDLARRRADGAYEIVGRIKSAIKSGGFLIVPEEVSEALGRHPAVAEVATVGLPDPDFGEIVVAAVVLDRPVDEAALLEHCRGILEAAKVPRRVIALDRIPRGEAGKPRLDELRSLLDANAPTSPADRKGVVDDVLSVASTAFRVPVTSLSLDMGTDDIPAWDSFAHVSLVLEAEKRFAVRIATADVASIRTLADLAAAIERAG
jgi:long-chain acyl-CoA synthetase